MNTLNTVVSWLLLGLSLASSALVIQWASLMRERAVPDDALQPLLIHYIHPAALVLLAACWFVTLVLFARTLRNARGRACAEADSSGTEALQCARN